MIEIGSAIFNADHGRLAEEIIALDEAGIDFFHWDVFDGIFIPDIGFPPKTIQWVRGITKKPFEVHLGTLQPERYYLPLADAGADLIFMPVEPVPLLFEGLEQIRQLGMKPGISLALGTPISQLEAVLPYIERILVLTRAYGETVEGTHFVPSAITKIEGIREAREVGGLSFTIEAAGGLDNESSELVTQSGADAITLGGALHNNKSSADALYKIRAKLDL